MPADHLYTSELQPLTADTDDDTMAGSDADKHHTLTTTTSYHDDPTSTPITTHTSPSHTSPPHPHHRVYKRRFLGLTHLTLLNILISWNWLSYAPVSTTSATYFHTTESAINWLSTAFLFAFVVASPAAVYTLNRSVKGALVVAAGLMLVGSWIRYAGTRAGNHGNLGAALFGQCVIGLAQPFVLAAPTRYSDLWFTESGRISATAVASLGNPFGGALGQLIDPFWATEAGDIPNMVLYVAVITTIITLPTPFLPSHPPTPPTPTSTATAPTRITFSTLTTLAKTPSFYLLTLPFITYVSAFNATSSLLNQILSPYNFTEDEAGIGGALLIVIGLVAAAISSPLLDRFKTAQIPVIKVLVPVVAAMYITLIFTPSTRSLAANYVVLSLLGAASFSLVPLALELLVEVTYGIAGPEVSSTIGWTGGQLGGAVLILVMDALKGAEGEPRGSLRRGLVLQGFFACVVVPCVVVLGSWGTGRSRRLEAGREREREEG